MILSIIIPSYNSAHLLLNTLESIRKQNVNEQM